MIAMSKTRSGPLCAIWTMPRAFAIGIASASARCGRGPRVMGGASFFLVWFFHGVCYLLFFFRFSRHRAL